MYRRDGPFRVRVRERVRSNTVQGFINAAPSARPQSRHAGNRARQLAMPFAVRRPLPAPRVSRHQLAAGCQALRCGSPKPQWPSKPRPSVSALVYRMQAAVIHPGSATREGAAIIKDITRQSSGNGQAEPHEPLSHAASAIAAPARHDHRRSNASTSAASSRGGWILADRSCSIRNRRSLVPNSCNCH